MVRGSIGDDTAVGKFGKEAVVDADKKAGFRGEIFLNRKNAVFDMILKRILPVISGKIVRQIAGVVL